MTGGYVLARVADFKSLFYMTDFSKEIDGERTLLRIDRFLGGMVGISGNWCAVSNSWGK